MDVRIKRVYEPSDPADGTRVLVDRLWPRGVSKAEAHLDLWEKDAAPSPELRKEWHAEADGHDPEHFKAFAADYRAELSSAPAAAAVEKLAALAHGSDRLTLLYGARDEKVNHAVVLREVLLERLS
jgi:uncharacterized protein YeaO (DUF488 family)